MKRLSITALAVAAVGFSGVALANTEYVELFDATPITPTGEWPESNLSGIEVDFEKRFVFATAEATVYCGEATTAYVKTDNGDGTYGPPIVDNFMTGGDDDVSICIDGTNISQISGTNCFNTAAGTRPAGEPMEKYYTAAQVTAHVDLDVGKNDLQFKLWDFGVDLGNTKLVLELPEACSAEPDSSVKVSGGIGFGKAERGNSPTHTFDGYVYQIGHYVGGQVNINFRLNQGNCTFTFNPNVSSFDITRSVVGDNAYQAILRDWSVAGEYCSRRPEIRFLNGGPHEYFDSVRGGVLIPSELENLDGTSLPPELGGGVVRWIPLETGNVEVFIKN